jgi:hypothetical protein
MEEDYVKLFLNFIINEDGKFKISKDGKFLFYLNGKIIFDNNNFLLFDIEDQRAVTEINGIKNYLVNDYGKLSFSKRNEPLLNNKIDYYHKPKTKNNLLGEYMDSGSYSLVFKYDESSVIKVGFINDILDEYKNIKCLPQPGPYYNTNNIEIIKLSDEDVRFITDLPQSYHVKSQIKDNIIINEYEKNGPGNIKDNKFKYDIDVTKFTYEMSKDHIRNEIKDFNLYMIKLPLIKGITLYDFFDQYPIIIDSIKYEYKIKNIQHELYLRSIPDEQIINMLKCLYELYNFIQILNTHYYIYHNDLHYKNLIYDGNKLIIIDFALMTIGLNNNLDKDIRLIIIYMKYLILCGCFSMELKELFFLASIIRDENIIDIDNIEENFLINIKLVI